MLEAWLPGCDGRPVSHPTALRLCPRLAVGRVDTSQARVRRSFGFVFEAIAVLLTMLSKTVLSICCLLHQARGKHVVDVNRVVKESLGLNRLAGAEVTAPIPHKQRMDTLIRRAITCSERK